MKSTNKLNLPVIIAMCGLYSLSFAGNITPLTTPGDKGKEASPMFTENKGQVSDQYHKPRPDVLFSGTSGGMAYHLRNTGISYQLSNVGRYSEKKLSPFSNSGDSKHCVTVAEQITIYRLDINWIGANQKSSIQTDAAIDGYNNYYLEVCPAGATRVKTYTGLCYKNLYKGIDLHYYGKEGKLKYDYLVAAGADYKLIQLQVEGAGDIACKNDGSIVFTTPLGEITEGAPLVYQNGKKLIASWKIQNKVLSFDIENYNPSLPLLIDPVVRVWGTYYGDAGSESGFSNCADASGNVYMAGVTDAAGTSIATVGSHQATFAGFYGDAFLVKFNTNGVRQWGTYYGGSGYDFGNSCALDPLGNVYLAGGTSSDSSTVIATPGSHQPVCGGATDAFLVQFNSSGVRQWGTYYGGIGNEFSSCSCDASGNVYLGGSTSSLANISTGGCHQFFYGGGPNDAFLVKFNNSGVRQWGTYYGSTGEDVGTYNATDANGNIMIVGITSSAFGTALVSLGCHQYTYGGGSYDGFLVKLDSNGVRQWGTYYGGAGRDYANCCATDIAGNIFIAGDTQTNSGMGIATLNGFQFVYGGGPPMVSDAYLAMFNSAGVRQWGTYYGTQQDEKAYGLTCDIYGNIYVAGQTTSGSQISTNGTPQVFNGGGYDAFLARFTILGTRIWGTFYGGYGFDIGRSCCMDASNNIYVVGSTQTSSTTGTVITTNGSHQSVYGGMWDVFLVKFNDCDAPNAPPNNTPLANQSICPNTITSLMVNASDTINWFASPTSTTVLGSGNTFPVQGLSSGTYTYYAAATNSCFATGPRTPILLNVLPVPLMSVSGPSAICSGQNAALLASGAGSYTWNSPGGVGPNAPFTVVTPSTNTSYTVTGGFALNTCTSSVTFNLLVNPKPVIAVTGPTAICAKQNAVLSASGANSYTWNSGPTTAYYMVSPNTTTSYIVTGGFTSNTCTSSVTFNLIVNPIPTIVLIGPSSICASQNATLMASGGTSYVWDSGATTATNVVAPAVSSTYTVIAMLAGCSASKVFSITVEECTGIGNIAAGTDVKLFPNPTTGLLNLLLPLSLSNSDDLNWQIINSLGQTVIHSEAGINYSIASEQGLSKIEIDTRLLSKGVYYIQFKEIGVGKVYKLVKE